MADEETQAGSPPVVVPNSIEQSLRGHFERILLISEEAAASLAEQVMEVFTEREGGAGAAADGPLPRPCHRMRISVHLTASLT